jgi:tetratricopeptide (TPR) repeat protein
LHVKDTADLFRRADRALNEQREEEVVGVLAAAAERAGNDPALWQWTALLHRALDRQDLALQAFERATRLAPAAPMLAHGHARVALEAGLDAVALFETACRLAPLDGSTLLGRAAARLAVGDGETAERELAALLSAHPGWIEGHEKLARLRVMLGKRDALTASLDEALALAPREIALWTALLGLLFHGGRFSDLRDAARRGRAAAGASLVFDVNEAIALSELGEVEAADRLFAQLPGDDPLIAVHQVRHLLRNRRPEAALPLVERWTRDAATPHMWPYAALVWRLTGDPRADWFDGHGALVSVVDLSDRLPPLERLAALLRGLHRAREQHLDQSVRGGTQTDGALFSRIEPELRAVREAVLDAVSAYVRVLPPRDPAHPTLAPRRDRKPRFAGSWSVRLPAGGFHASHIHQEGWISSALYVKVPEAAELGPEPAGWLALGEPPSELGLDLGPLRLIRPKPGQLVLFPSVVWHGTRPFESGERLTIAFDIARPPGG